MAKHNLKSKCILNENLLSIKICLFSSLLFILFCNQITINFAKSIPSTASPLNSSTNNKKMPNFLKTNLDPIGEAFRKQISNLDDGHQTWIDQLSTDEINEYQRTGRLPGRSRDRINELLMRNSNKDTNPKSAMILFQTTATTKSTITSNKKEEWPSSFHTSSGDPIALNPSDRYEIVKDDGQTILLSNEVHSDVDVDDDDLAVVNLENKSKTND